ncbi:MAG: right-handed parallel beta-helix repeat-containing protein [Phycisphaerae bacterium]|nr:right-handed parallel beta-helix repeat-containing protein [Phycisphaerae bacterium]
MTIAQIARCRAGSFGAFLSVLILVGCSSGGAGGGPGAGGGSTGEHTVTITVSPAGAGQVALNPDRSGYATGEMITLTATAASGFAFERWAGDAGGTANPLTVTITGDLTIEAVFAEADVEPELHDSTVVLDETMQLEERGEGRFRLSGDDLPSLFPGAVLVSAADGLRPLRVLAVEAADGVYEIETEPAGLTDLIRRCRLNLAGRLDMSQAGMDANLKPHRAGRIAVENGSLVISDVELEFPDKVTLTLDGRFAFNPDFDLVLDVEDGRIQRFRCTAAGQVSAGLDAEIEVTALTDALSKEISLVELEWPRPAGVIMLGSVPVLYQFFLTLNLGAEVAAGELGTFSAGLDLDAGLELGGEYIQSNGVGSWNRIADLTFDPDADVPDVSLSPVRAKVYLEPEFGVKFYAVAGPSISYEESLELVADTKFDELGVELRNGHTLDLNFTFDILDRVKFQYTHNLYDDTDVLMARLAFGADPPELGTVGYAPGGLADFYWHTESVDVWGDPASGYELAGFSVRHLLSNRSRVEKVTELEDEPTDASKLITAHFVPKGEGDDWSGSGITGAEGRYVLTVEVFPPGAGRVILFPTLEKYRAGDQPLVQAVASDGFVFHHWEKAVSGTEPVTRFTVSGSNTLRAVFASSPPRHLRVPGDYATLQEALNAVTYNDVIELGPGTFTGDGFRDLETEGRYLGGVTICGEGCDVTVIDLQAHAEDCHRLVFLDHVEGTLRIESLTIRNGYAGYAGPADFADGGAIHVATGYGLYGDGLASLEVASCCFESCGADDDGSAIHFGDPAADQHLTLSACRFTDCGGDSVVQVESGYESMAVAVEGCTFSASPGGGLEVNDFTGLCTIRNSRFEDNTATPLVLRGATDVLVSDSAFVGNRNSSNGGAINSERSSVLVETSTFEGNSAEGQAYAGAVWTRDAATFEACTFTNNIAHIGGAASIDTGGVLRRCVFSRNQATANGGGAYLAGQAFDCTFMENTARVDGGAVYLYAGTLEACTMTENEAGLWGGAVSIASTGSVVSACVIERNRAGGGGGIEADSAVIRNCLVCDNEATEHEGGGITADDSSIYACTVSGNRATTRQAGGVAAFRCLVSGCTIDNNTAGEEGGGLTLYESTLSYCTIRENVAPEAGGVLCWGTESNLYANTLTANQPDDCSGCVACDSSADAQP